MSSTHLLTLALYVMTLQADVTVTGETCTKHHASTHGKKDVASVHVAQAAHKAAATAACMATATIGSSGHGCCANECACMRQQKNIVQAACDCCCAR